MHTVATKPRPARPVTSPKTAQSQSAFAAGRRDLHAMFGIQRTLGNQAALKAMQAAATRGDAGSAGARRIQRTVGDGHDLRSPRFAGISPLEAAFDDERYVAMGERGEHVAVLQQALVDHGHELPKHGVDGIFGPETRDAVKDYQGGRGLRVDGIVGPETMGDLDSLYAKGPPDPDIPPDVCSVPVRDGHSLSETHGFVPVASLTPQQRERAEQRPTVELPGGDTAVACGLPPGDQGCRQMCGCPLPSSSYTAKVGDIAQTLEHATAFHEDDASRGQDARTLVCPPKDTAITVLEIRPSGGGMIFLKVLFCSGPQRDKNGKGISVAFIQQRFADRGTPLAIAGPAEIVMPDTIRLRAEGAHPGTAPVWSIEHDPDSHGRAEIAGPDREASVELKGTSISSLQGDVAVRLSACRSSALHSLTVRKPFEPHLPVPPLPKEPPGPQKHRDDPSGYCEPMTDRARAEENRSLAKARLSLFIAAQHGNNKDALDLYMTYLDTPKTGTRGVLPTRRLFSDQTSDFIKSFVQDFETLEQRKRIARLIAERVKKDPRLVPPVGKTTLWLPFRTVLSDAELLDLDMSFEDPFTRIPGLVAGGHGKAASDAGDDVRNVDGQFRVTNQGAGTLRIQIQSTFDIFDAVDFCPGAHGSFWAQVALTMVFSQLEATPDIPTYDTPFEVIYTVSDDLIV